MRVSEVVFKLTRICKYSYFFAVVPFCYPLYFEFMYTYNIHIIRFVIFFKILPFSKTIENVSKCVYNKRMRNWQCVVILFNQLKWGYTVL